MAQKKEETMNEDDNHLLLKPLSEEKIKFLENIKPQKFDKEQYIKENITFFSQMKNVGAMSENGFESLFQNEMYKDQIEDWMMVLGKELLETIKEKIKTNE